MPNPPICERLGNMQLHKISCCRPRRPQPVRNSLGCPVFNLSTSDAKHRAMTDINLIRNFAIIAHIDHGKSTLSDRLIQLCGNVPDREMKEQILELDGYRARARHHHQGADRAPRLQGQGRQTYQLNLMDTPGHVDFAYEVSRSLAACEGAVLVVDASQGVEAQTLANVYQALDNNLEILPVLNKVDLPAADADRVKQQIEEVIGLDASHAIPISAKTGQNVEAVLEAIVARLPAPKGNAKAPLKALLIDSWYDAYLGVVVLVRVIDGALKKGQRIRLMASGGAYQVERVGIFRPKQEMLDQLGPGEVGFFTAAIKQVADTRVGDTVTDEKHPTPTALPGFKPSQPVVFCGLFPVDAAQFEDLREAMARLRLNDASFTYETESSAALGLRLPLRLPRAPAPGDHHRAARARVQSRAHHHGAQRHLSRLSQRRHASWKCTTRPTCPTPSRSTASRSRGSRPPSWCRTSTWGPC